MCIKKQRGGVSIKFDGYESILTYLNIEEKGNIEVHGKITEKAMRSCLFCGKTFPETNFSKIAHAVSETIGNKSLVSHFECDQCNAIFGELFEDALGKYLLPYKIVSQVYGKKNRLVTKDMTYDKQLSYGTYQIQFNKNTPILDGMEVNGLIIEQSSKGILTTTEDGFDLNIPRQHYKPGLVFCAFLKMAYSLLPLELYPQYVRRFIELQRVSSKSDECFNDEEKKQYIKRLPNCGYFSFAPGINPFNGINVFLLKRKNDNKKMPRLLFQIQMINFSFVIPVLSDNEFGNFTLPRAISEKKEECFPLDFSKEEKNFRVSFSAQKIDIKDKKYLKDILKENKLIK